MAHTCRFLLALLVLGPIGLAVLVDSQAADSPAPRLPAGWFVGDVHVHAAGDSGLDGHLHCRDAKSKDECADVLVRDAVARAKLNGAQWIILTEHIPWLGINPKSVELCPKAKLPFLAVPGTGGRVAVPEVGGCQNIPVPVNDPRQATDDYNRLKNAAQRAAQAGNADDPRPLMGQEMGTAAGLAYNPQPSGEAVEICPKARLPFLAVPRTGGGVAVPEVGGCVNVPGGKELRNAARRIPSAIRKLTEGDCPGVESGHFGLYYVPRPINDSVYNCNESEYLRNAAAHGAWGAVNHPDNENRGSRWFCWNHGDRAPLDRSLTGADDNHDGPPCQVSVADEPETARAVEIVNETNMPTQRALTAVDSLLLQGQRMALVGGSDAHSVKVAELGDQEVWFPQRIVRLGPSPLFGYRVFDVPRHIEGNAGNIGLVGRTYVRSGPLTPPEHFRTDDPNDPVREAIAHQRTVASTGPLALPHIGNSFPGDTAIVKDGSIELRVDLYAARGLQPLIPADVRRIEVILGQRGSCPSSRDATTSPCVDEKTRRTSFCTDRRDAQCDEDLRTEKGGSYALLRVPMPEDITNGFVRTEALFGKPRDEPDDRFRYGQRYDQGAFSSPIWIQPPVSRMWQACNRSATSLAARLAGVPAALDDDRVLRSVFRNERPSSRYDILEAYCADFDGDGDVDRAAWYSCCTVSSPSSVVILRNNGAGFVLAYKRFDDSIGGVRLAGYAIRVRESQYSRGDGGCCPSHYRDRTLQWTGDSFKSTTVVRSAQDRDWYQRSPTGAERDDIVRAVKDSSLTSAAPDDAYDVVGIEVSTAAAPGGLYGRFDLKPNRQDIQGAYGIVRKRRGRWKLIELGGSGVGCRLPPVVRSDLQLECP